MTVRVGPIRQAAMEREALELYGKNAMAQPDNFYQVRYILTKGTPIGNGGLEIDLDSHEHISSTGAFNDAFEAVGAKAHHGEKTRSAFFFVHATGALHVNPNTQELNVIASRAPTFEQELTLCKLARSQNVDINLCYIHEDQHTDITIPSDQVTLEALRKACDELFRTQSMERS